MSHRKSHTYWITASEEHRESDVPEAMFPYWSFTKTVLAICALKLVEEGRLTLDAPLEGAAYTLRQLLNHASGLPDYGQFPEYGAAVRAGGEPWPRDEMLRTALAKGMLFAPEQGWSYSNIGYMFIKELIERTEDKPLADLIADRITTPLGLQSVALAQSPDQFVSLHWPAAATYDPGWVYHGCLVGTVADAARLLHRLFAGDLLTSASLREMTRTTPLGGAIAGRPWATCGYALGLMSGTVAGIGRVIGHSGAGPFSVNAVYHFPDRSEPVTVASFTDGTDEGVAEYVATKTAMRQTQPISGIA